MENLINDSPTVLSSTIHERVLSIDVFRGLTIFTMIFVNDLASIKNIPAWMKHVPAEADAMTFVDLVFPAFLFIVGMAIPFAINKRISKGDTSLQIWKHILIRTAGLIILGVFMVNLEGFNEGATGISKSLWMLLLFIAAILVWNQYPKTWGTRKIFFFLLRSVGITVLIFLAVIYRGGEIGNIHWMKTSWWGILGLIGWSYLTCCAIYFLCRKNLAAMIGMLAVFISLYIGDEGGALDFLSFISKYVWLGGHIGGHASITTAGMIVAILFLEDFQIQNPKQKIIWIATFAGIMFIIGYFLRPLYGISKINATPSWSLYSSAICCLIFAFLYWLIDIRKISRWAIFLKPAGANPLLAYILPDIYYALMGLFSITILADYFGEGLAGIVRSFVLALVILGFTALLTKFRIRLHL